MYMAPFLFFLLFVAPLVSSSQECSVNIFQRMQSSENVVQSVYEVLIENDSHFVVHRVLLTPQPSLSAVDNMNVTAAGLEFPAHFHGLAPKEFYRFRYSKEGFPPAHFQVSDIQCGRSHLPNRTFPSNVSHHNESHHNFPPNTTSSHNHTHHNGTHHRPTHAPTPSAAPAPPSPTSPPAPAPSAAPTAAPSAAPTTAAVPSHAPSHAPTHNPTHNPTHAPTEAPAPAPTEAPTPAPTEAPTPAPTEAPAPAPTETPTPAPTEAPTPAPTEAPAPTQAPAPATPTASPSTPSPSGFCSGVPKTFNGKPCASTTRYWDGNLGACGCGDSSGAFPWVGTQYTAATSPPLFGPQTDCGTGCGKCYNITTTGFSAQGRGAPAGESIIIMVTNLCPSGGDWCAPGLNTFNYAAHFDLANNPSTPLIDNLGWDNPEVIYEEVACTGALNSPTEQDFAQCVCTTPN